MSNRKKKRNRSRSRPAPGGGGNGSRGADQRKAAVARPGRTEAEPARAEGRGTMRRHRLERSPAAEERPRGLFAGRMREPSPYPPLRESASAGVSGVASSLPAVALGFLGLFAVWAAFAAVGLAEGIGSRFLGGLMSVPPLFLIFPFEKTLAFFPVVGDSTLAGLGISVGLTMLRVIAAGGVVALVASRLGWTEERPGPAFRRALPHLALIGLMMFGVGAALPYLVAAILGNIGLLLFLVGPLLGVHFLVYAPVVAITEGAGYREAVRRSARAARLPGASHLLLTFGYFVISLFLISAIPAAAVDPVTPSVGSWAVALGLTFVHLAVLATFAHRWLSVRHLVPADASRAERPAA